MKTISAVFGQMALGLVLVSGLQGCGSSSDGNSCPVDCQSGEKQCVGKLLQVCADDDGNGCNEWLSEETCSGTCEVDHCVEGECTGCTIGDKRCSKGKVQECVNNDEDPCGEWGIPKSCEEGLTCTGEGECKTTCDTKLCQEDGQKGCVDQDTFYECVKENACFKLNQTDCELGQTCDKEAGCVCVDLCENPDELRCNDTVVEKCVDGTLGCNLWEKVEDCKDSGGSCNNLSGNVECTSSCQDECASEGVTSCQEETLQACEKKTDGCLHLVDKEYCKLSNKTCDDSTGTAMCLSACQDDAREENDSRDQASAIVAEELYDGVICAGDADWFQFEAQAGDTMVLDLIYDLPTNLDVEIIDSNGNTVAAGNSQGDEEYLEVQATAGGSYFLRVFGATAEQEGYYLFLVELISSGTCQDDSLEDNDSSAEALPVIPEDIVDGIVCPADEDWFQFDASQGDPITLDLLYDSQEGNIDVEILDANQQTLIAGNSAGDEELLETTIPATGTFFIRVYGATAEDQGYYVFSFWLGSSAACEDDDLEENDTRAEAPKVLGGDLFDRRICPGDEDWYAFDAYQGEDIWVTLHHTASAGNLWVEIVDVNNAVLASDHTGDDSKIVVAEGVSQGVYYAHVLGESTEVQNAYDLKIEFDTATCEDDSFEENDTLETAKNVTYSTYEALQICSGDEDWFKLVADSTDIIEVLMIYDQNICVLGLELYDSKGTELDSSTSGTGEEFVTTTAPLPDYYFIHVVAANYCENSYSMEISLGY